MTVAFRRIHPDAVLPAYAHEGDAGMDVRSVDDVVIPPGRRALVHTGLVMQLPPCAEAQGLNSKLQTRILACSTQHTLKTLEVETLPGSALAEPAKQELPPVYNSRGFLVPLMAKMPLFFFPLLILFF